MTLRSKHIAICLLLVTTFVATKGQVIIRQMCKLINYLEASSAPDNDNGSFNVRSHHGTIVEVIFPEIQLLKKKSTRAITEINISLS